MEEEFEISMEFEPEGGTDIVFHPDDALIMALNEVNDLREMVGEQNEAIEQLKKDLIELKKQSGARL